jgi:hypothetical protein
MNSLHWQIAGYVYPGPLAAPDWRWTKVDNQWVEVNRPEPILTEVHPTTDLVSAMKDKRDYPPEQHSHVDDFNHIYRGSVRLALARIETDWRYRAEVEKKHQHGAMRLRLFEMTDNFTRSWSCSEYGYVHHG